MTKRVARNQPQPQLCGFAVSQILSSKNRGLSVLHCPPDFAWANGNLAERAEQLSKKLEHPNQSQPNRGARPDEYLDSVDTVAD